MSKHRQAIIKASEALWSKRYEAARDLALVPAQEGNKHAQCILGRAMHWSGGSLDEELEGLEWLDRAANNGHADSAIDLAHYLAICPPETSVKLFASRNPEMRTEAQYNRLGLRMAIREAEAGNPCAMNLAGVLLYLVTAGVERDLEAAELYFKAAVAKGNGVAAFNLAHVLRELGRGFEAVEAVEQGMKLGEFICPWDP